VQVVVVMLCTRHPCRRTRSIATPVAKLTESANKVNKKILQSAFEELLEMKSNKGKLAYGDITAVIQ
jgi:hypothetical protein